MRHITDQLATHVFGLSQFLSHLVEAERQLGQFVQFAFGRIARHLYAFVVMPICDMMAGDHHRLYWGDHLAADEYAERLLGSCDAL